MSDLRDLYQEVILDHGRQPRNFHTLPDANHAAEGHNPLCGDTVTIHLHLDRGIITNVAFEGAGCAISMASASIMTEMVKGKTEEQARALFKHFHQMMTQEQDTADSGDNYDKLAVFSGVREFPMRVKCATLAWHTLKAALDGQQNDVTTE